MALARQYEHVEALVGADEGIHDAIGVRRVDIVVDVTGDKQQAAPEVPRQLGVRRDTDGVGRVGLGDLLADAVVLLAPPAVVDVVVVVAGAGDRRLEEVGVGQDGRRRHESAAAVAMDADTVHIHPRIALAKLLDGVFLVLQAVIAQVPVAVVVVPFRAHRMAAAVADGHDDEAELRQAVGAGHTLAPGDVDGLHLRTGINVVADGIDLRGVEVKRLVDGAVKVRHAVRRLDLETLREAVSGLEQAGEVGLLEVHDRAAGRDVDQHDERLGVHPGGVGNEVFRIIGGRREDVHVIHVELDGRTAADSDTVVVHLVRILARDHAAGAEDHILAGRAEDGLDMVGTLREVALQRSVRTIEIEVGPAVALAPPDEVAAGEEHRVAPLLVGVHPFADEGFRAVGINPDIAEVDLVEVAAEAVHIETGVVPEPAHAEVVFGSVGGGLPGIHDSGVLVFEGRHRDLAGGAGVDVKDVQGTLRGRFAGHLVVVGLEGRTGLAHGVDDPELLHRRHVPADDGEMTAVRRPGDIREAALRRVRHGVAMVVLARPGPFGRAVGGQGTFDDERILRVRGGKAQRCGVHHEQVVVPDIDAAGAIRGDARPAGIAVFLLLGRESQLFRGDLIGEMIADRALLCPAERVGLRTGRLDVELEILVLLELQALHRDVGSLERVTDDLGELHGQFLHVEHFGLGLFHRVDDIVFRPLGGLPTVPELVAPDKPVRADAGRIDHLGDLLLREAFSKAVVGPPDVLLFFRSFLRRGRQRQAAQQDGNG